MRCSGKAAFGKAGCLGKEHPGARTFSVWRNGQVVSVKQKLSGLPGKRSSELSGVGRRGLGQGGCHLKILQVL